MAEDHNSALPNVTCDGIYFRSGRKNNSSSSQQHHYNASNDLDALQYEHTRCR
jgi:hypothetical protein